MPISATLVRKLTTVDPALRDVLLSFISPHEAQPSVGVPLPAPLPTTPD